MTLVAERTEKESPFLHYSQPLVRVGRGTSCGSAFEVNYAGLNGKLIYSTSNLDGFLELPRMSLANETTTVLPPLKPLPIRSTPRIALGRDFKTWHLRILKMAQGLFR